jgi:hypothetical protein
MGPLSIWWVGRDCSGSPYGDPSVFALAQTRHRRAIHASGVQRSPPDCASRTQGGFSLHPTLQIEKGPDGAFVNLVGRAGFEPTTNGLKVRCSTD